MKHTHRIRWALSLILAVAMAAGLFVGLTLTASAADADIVWEDGKVIAENMTLGGDSYTAENPLTVQVKGTVTLSASITIQGYVKLVGADSSACLKMTGFSNGIANKCFTTDGKGTVKDSLTLEGLTIDGAGCTQSSVIYFKEGDLTMKNVTVKNLTLSSSQSFAYVQTGYSDKKNAGEQAVHIIDGCTFESNAPALRTSTTTKIFGDSTLAYDSAWKISNSTFRGNGLLCILDAGSYGTVTLGAGNVFDCAEADCVISSVATPSFDAMGANDLSFNGCCKVGPTNGKKTGYVTYDETAAAWQWSEQTPADCFAITVQREGVSTSGTVKALFGCPARKAGETVRFLVNPEKGGTLKYYVSQVAMSQGESTDKTVLTPDADGYYSFTMPSEPVVLTLTTVNKDVHAMTVVQSEHGTLKISSPTTATTYVGKKVYVDGTPDQCYALEAVTCQTESGASVPVTLSGSSWQFTMPDEPVTVTGTFVQSHNYVHGTCTVCSDKAYTPGKWDGTLDFTWYDESKPQTSYTITTEAEWEALAWVCSEHLSELATLGEGTYTNGNVTKIVGTVPTQQNTFAGVSFKLDADLDFGGVKAGDGTWSGLNYYPIGSQGADDKGTGTWYGLFYGSFDGQGHTVANIYCDRRGSVGYRDSQSTGLFGRVGSADDAASAPDNDIIIENFLVTGHIHAARSVGGIVGKTLHVGSGHKITIRNCVNAAEISSTDSKGVGGIVGALWNSAEIRDCINLGTVTGAFRSACTGGIAGTNDGCNYIYNCLNLGTVTNTASGAYMGALVGNESAASLTVNSYYLDTCLDTSASGTAGLTNFGTAKTAAEIADPALVTALGESYKASCGAPVLSWQTAVDHTEAVDAEIPATCTEPGKTAGSHCSVCGVVVTAQTDVPAKGHDLQHHDAVAAACKQDGSKEYWSCAACGLLFADEAGTIETTAEELVIPGLAHAWSEASYVWTETADGYACTGSVYCLRDGCEYYPQSKPMTEEAAVTMAVKTAPTCTAAGEAAYTASFSNNKIETATKTVALPATGHTEVTDAAVAPTCTAPGKTEGSHCSVCNEILVAQTEVAALGHDYVETARVDATESAAGSVTYTCSRCHDSYTETLAEIACPSVAYTDVPAYGNWAHAGIDYCVANGLMNGMSANRFEPKGTLTRAQLVTILYRVAGQPAVTTSGTFTDLTANWYKNAVEWAAANGVVKGYPDGTFRPDEAITREQIATILYRFDEASKAEEDKLAGFPDAADVSGWAADGLNWAVNEGLINGVASQGTSYLQPKATATRDQIAAIIMRYLNSK